MVSVLLAVSKCSGNTRVLRKRGIPRGSTTLSAPLRVLSPGNGRGGNSVDSAIGNSFNSAEKSFVLPRTSGLR